MVAAAGCLHDAPIPSLFPEGLPLIHGHDLTAGLADWCAARIPAVGAGAEFGPCWAVGVMRDRRLAAVVVYHDYRPSYGTVQMSVAADTPRWASAPVIAALLGAPFRGILGAPVHKIRTYAPTTNGRALKFNKGIGLRREATLQGEFGPGQDAAVFALFRDEWNDSQRQESP